MVSLLLDTEVDYDFKKYGEESVAADEDKLKTYNPVNIEWSKLKYQNRTAYLTERGISTNNDGSTNNLPEYFWYQRECYSKKMDWYFGLFFVWAYVGGALMYYISFGTLHGVTGVQDGVVNDYWNSAVGVYATLCYVYHFYTFFEFRSFSFPVMFGWTFSFCMYMPLCIHWAQNRAGGTYQGS